MARKELSKIAAEARVSFDEMSAKVDSLAVDEETFAINPNAAVVAVRELKELARITSANFNSAAPVVDTPQMRTFRETSLMLSEISLADGPKIFFERFHARREDIESGLLSLSE